MAKTDAATTQAAKTETTVKYVGLKKPPDVDIELQSKVDAIDMQTEEMINLYNGGINVTTNDQTSVVNEYGVDRETDTDNAEAVSNFKRYNRQLYRGSKVDSGNEGGKIVSREMITMRPTLPYYYKYEANVTATSGGTGKMRLDFNAYKYPLKLSVSNSKFCQAMIVGTGRIDATNVIALEELIFPFPSIFGSVTIDPDTGKLSAVEEYSTGTISIADTSIESDFHNWVTLYDEVGLPVRVNLGPHFDQIAYDPSGKFSFPQATHLKTAEITGYVDFSFIIQGHVSERLFNSYEWDGCTIADDRIDPMGVWD